MWRVVAQDISLVSGRKTAPRTEPRRRTTHHFDDTGLSTLEEYAAADVSARPATRKQV